MNKIINIFALIVLAAVINSCTGSSRNQFVAFDHEGQALKDNDSLQVFFTKHYYDTEVDSVKTLVEGKTALSEDANLKTLELSENEIDYKLYYYLTNVGTPTVDKGFPKVTDSIFSTYQLWKIVRADSIALTETGSSPIWWSLTTTPAEGYAPSPIKGWKHGFTVFKNGDNITNNGPITYENGGKGILFLPSGLAYANQGSASIAQNQNLIFYVNLYEFVKDTDHDNDGVPSWIEDLDSDKDATNDDTDKDFFANYLDADDDGDGVLTKDEDANGDGNPANDFSDPNNPTLPDYLNRNIK